MTKKDLIDKIKITLLKDLLNHEIIGGVHLPQEKLIRRALPSHLRGNGKKALKDLQKSGFVLRDKAHYGYKVRLNLHTLKEVREIIKKATLD